MSTTISDSPARREPELVGQTVVVIGGSAGIGLETGRRARAECANIILTGRNPDRLRQAARELGALSTAAFDATDPAPLDRLRSYRLHFAQHGRDQLGDRGVNGHGAHVRVDRGARVHHVDHAVDRLVAAHA